MFYSLTGKLTFADGQIAVIDCGGVGFKCFITLNTRQSLPRTGEAVTLYTYLSVREDALDLYGFATMQELEFFKLITSVSGVGNKIALAILSDFSPEGLSVCIATGDSKTITRVPGVGPKAASRIVLELKDKVGGLPEGKEAVGAAGIVSASDNASQAVAALASLGYSQSEASMAVARLDSQLPVEELIREGLKALARQF